MINPNHLRLYIIKPVLASLSLESEAAENLLLGTAAVESDMGSYLAQSGGPALGIYQMEPATARDLIGWSHSERHPQGRSWYSYILNFFPLGSFAEPDVVVSQLPGLLYLATALCRLRYYRVPEPLPNPGDVPALAAYWKQHYNTPLGAGTVGKFVEKYSLYVEGPHES